MKNSMMINIIRQHISDKFFPVILEIGSWEVYGLMVKMMYEKGSGIASWFLGIGLIVAVLRTVRLCITIYYEWKEKDMNMKERKKKYNQDEQHH